MKVECKNSAGEVIWFYYNETQEGLASLGYTKDGTQKTITAALECALEQARAQLCATVS